MLKISESIGSRGKIKNASLNLVSLKDNLWVVGGLALSNGADLTSVTRIRHNAYIQFQKGIEFTVSVSGGCKCIIRTYPTAAASTESRSSGFNRSNTMTLNENENFFRFAIAYNDDRELMLNDIWRIRPMFNVGDENAVVGYQSAWFGQSFSNKLY
jgi:hypothetical protein